jgi:hypothetical protein
MYYKEGYCNFSGGSNNSLDFSDFNFFQNDVIFIVDKLLYQCLDLLTVTLPLKQSGNSTTFYPGNQTWFLHPQMDICNDDFPPKILHLS